MARVGQHLAGVSREWTGRGWREARVDRRRADASPPRTGFLRADLRRLPFHPHTLDNAIDEGVIRHAFTGWRIDHMRQAAVPSETRALDVLIARLVNVQFCSYRSVAVEPAAGLAARAVLVPYMHVSHIEIACSYFDTNVEPGGWATPQGDGPALPWRAAMTVREKKGLPAGRLPAEIDT
jgi:hypothetical protein